MLLAAALLLAAQPAADQTDGFRDDQIRLVPLGDTRLLVEHHEGGSDPQNRVVNLAPEMPISIFRRFFPPGAPIC